MGAVTRVYFQNAYGLRVRLAAWVRGWAWAGNAGWAGRTGYASDWAGGSRGFFSASAPTKTT